RYFNNQELESTLKSWVETYPGTCALSTIGESFEKRPIWLLTLTNHQTGADIEKPAIWLDGNIHATEIAGTTTVLFIAYNLLTRYGEDRQITRLLDTCTFYLVPRINPDGADLAMSANPRYIRSGVRSYPFTEKDEGLHPQDIDGDGRILQMRIPDPAGDWKISSLDSRLMEKRGPNEQDGAFYRVLPEGLVEDYDGYLIKMARPVEGLDFNRNFPFEWRPEVEQSGAGPYPTSEQEIKGVADFIACHGNINTAITYHTFAGVILRPYSTRADDHMEVDDLRTYKKIGDLGTKLTGYRCVSTFHEFKYAPNEVTTGAFDDWMYDHHGAYTFTIELWDLPTKAGIKDRKLIEWYQDHPHEQDVQILKWADEHIGDGSYVNWYAYDHPQLGEIELGGWNSIYTWRNPPPAFMGEEAARNLPYVLALGDMLPHLSIYSLEAAPLGGDDYRINLVVENTGFFPTFTSAQGKKRQSIRPVRVELELPAAVTLVNGKKRVELGHLEGRSNKLDVTIIWGGSPTDNRARAEWVLHGPAGSEITFHIRSERAGSLHRTIKL
ncbi:MAG: M14 family metallopeptidase, partial [Omnitrophica WOR_2 bacterium]